MDLYPRERERGKWNGKPRLACVNVRHPPSKNPMGIAANLQSLSFLMGGGSGGCVLPEAGENGAHAQGREANCSLQRKIKKRA